MINPGAKVPYKRFIIRTPKTAQNRFTYYDSKFDSELPTSPTQSSERHKLRCIDRIFKYFPHVSYYDSLR